MKKLSTLLIPERQQTYTELTEGQGAIGWAGILWLLALGLIVGALARSCDGPDAKTSASAGTVNMNQGGYR